MGWRWRRRYYTLNPCRRKILKIVGDNDRTQQVVEIKENKYNSIFGTQIDSSNLYITSNCKANTYEHECFPILKITRFTQFTQVQ